MTNNHNSNKQTLWEIWFVLSAFLIVALLFIMTSDEELAQNPIVLNVLITSFISFIVSIIVGLFKL
jgi:hypothetical protein